MYMAKVGSGFDNRSGEHTPSRSDKEPVIFVVDDSDDVRAGLKALFESVNLECETFTSTAEFLQRNAAQRAGCLILDIRLPGTGGLDFQDELVSAGINIPIIFITGHGDIPMSVKAIKAGAVGFLTKPLREQDVLDAVREGLGRARAQREQERERSDLKMRFATLSDREREILAFVVSGLMNKQTAAKVGLSEVTVKVHRHNLMKKLCAKSVPELVRMVDILGVGGRR
jgi:FixJ family two-component response regulator